MPVTQRGSGGGSLSSVGFLFNKVPIRDSYKDTRDQAVQLKAPVEVSRACFLFEVSVFIVTFVIFFYFAYRTTTTETTITYEPLSAEYDCNILSPLSTGILLSSEYSEIVMYSSARYKYDKCMEKLGTTELDVCSDAHRNDYFLTALGALADDTSCYDVLLDSGYRFCYINGDSSLGSGFSASQFPTFPDKKSGYANSFIFSRESGVITTVDSCFSKEGILSEVFSDGKYGVYVVAQPSGGGQGKQFLFRLDATTGVCTVVADISFTTYYGFTFGSTIETLYAYTIEGFTGSIHQINVTSGVDTTNTLDCSSYRTQMETTTTGTFRYIDYSDDGYLYVMCTGEPTGTTDGVPPVTTYTYVFLQVDPITFNSVAMSVDINSLNGTLKDGTNTGKPLTSVNQILVRSNIAYAYCGDGLANIIAIDYGPQPTQQPTVFSSPTMQPSNEPSFGFSMTQGLVGISASTFNQNFESNSLLFKQTVAAILKYVSTSGITINSISDGTVSSHAAHRRRTRITPQSVGCVVDYSVSFTQTDVSTFVNVSTAYSNLTSTLADALDSGKFTETLQSYAESTTDASSWSNVTSTDVVISTLEVVSVPSAMPTNTRSPTQEGDNGGQQPTSGEGGGGGSGGSVPPSPSAPTRTPTTGQSAPSDATRPPSGSGSGSKPTALPSSISLQPSVLPTIAPTSASPSVVPTNYPGTPPPTEAPTVAPTLISRIPTLVPSMNPSIVPSVTPSLFPSVSPTISIAPVTLVPTMVPSQAQQPNEPPHPPPPGSGPPQGGSAPPTSIQPSLLPSFGPTVLPSIVPSVGPSSHDVSVSPSQAGSPTSPSNAPTAQPSILPSINPSYLPSLVPSVTPSRPPSITPTATPTAVPTSATPTEFLSLFPTQTPSFSQDPTMTPSNTLNILPSILPSITPTVNPTLNPSVAPSIPTTATPTAGLTYNPTSTLPPSPGNSPPPTVSPSIQPSLVPTIKPSNIPSLAPTLLPTLTPSRPPSLLPSQLPSATPTVLPTVLPTAVPTLTPSVVPSASPTLLPTVEPSVVPTTATPTEFLSLHPTAAPSYSQDPTVAPSESPSILPTLAPSHTPSINPTVKPSPTPTTVSPTFIPSGFPSEEPSQAPSIAPTTVPTSDRPTLIPTAHPTPGTPTFIPTFAASLNPTNPKPTIVPTLSPTNPKPTVIPTNSPAGGGGGTAGPSPASGGGGSAGPSPGGSPSPTANHRRLSDSLPPTTYLGALDSTMHLIPGTGNNLYASTAFQSTFGFYYINTTSRSLIQGEQFRNSYFKAMKIQFAFSYSICNENNTHTTDLDISLSTSYKTACGDKNGYYYQLNKYFDIPDSCQGAVAELTSATTNSLVTCPAIAAMRTNFTDYYCPKSFDTVCSTAYTDNPPFSCSRQVRSTTIALVGNSFSNASLVGSVLIVLIHFMLKRLYPAGILYAHGVRNKADGSEPETTTLEVMSSSSKKRFFGWSRDSPIHPGDSRREAHLDLHEIFHEDDGNDHSDHSHVEVTEGVDVKDVKDVADEKYKETLNQQQNDNPDGVNNFEEDVIVEDAAGGFENNRGAREDEFTNLAQVHPV